MQNVTRICQSNLNYELGEFFNTEQLNKIIVQPISFRLFLYKSNSLELSKKKFKGRLVFEKINGGTQM